MIATHNTPKQISIKQWDELSEKATLHNAFQTRTYYDFISEQTFMESFVFGVSEDGVLKGIMVGYILKDGGRIKQYFSRRAIVLGGPLLADDISQEALNRLLTTACSNLKGQVIYLEIRNFNDYSCHKSIYRDAGFKYEEHYNFHVDTTSDENIEKNMGKSRKRDAKISIREGAWVEKNPTKDDVWDLYHILEQLYTTKVKTPLFPITFFESLFAHQKNSFLIIKLNNTVIGGAVLMQFRDVTYEMYVCGLDGSYKSIHPSTLATYSGIHYAFQCGCTRFDFMGAGSPHDGGYGVRDFKAKFGGQLVEHGRFNKVFNPLLYNIGKFGVWILKHI